MSNYKVFRSIAVDADNYRRLALLGQVPDSFNTIVGRLLDEHEKIHGGKRDDTSSNTTNNNIPEAVAAASAAILTQ
jgi:hypothetical protein